MFSLIVENNEHIKYLTKFVCGKTPLQFKSAAYDLAEKYKIKHIFNDLLKLTGVDWPFIRRNLVNRYKLKTRDH